MSGGTHHLEYAQRDFLELLDEPMKFDEESIADVVDKIASESDDDSHRSFLFALARALRGTDSEFRLKLKGTKRRRFKSISKIEDEREFRRMVCNFIASKIGSGFPTEAAVAAASEYFRISRATVFKMQKKYFDEQKFLDEFWLSIDKKSRKTAIQFNRNQVRSIPVPAPAFAGGRRPDAKAGDAWDNSNGKHSRLDDCDGLLCPLFDWPHQLLP